MGQWFNMLSGFSKVTFILGTVMAIFLLIQVIMLIAGVGEDGDLEIDPSELDINDTGFGEIAGLRILSVRAVTIFLCIGSWVGFSLDSTDCHIALTIVISILSGALAAFLFAFAMKKAMKLQGEGNILFDNAIGKDAEVYLTIPADNNRFGKIMVLVQERMIEMDAKTIDDTEIKTGERVYVENVINNIAIVRRK